jgi:aldehyde dehydrogenase (NAD+)
MLEARQADMTEALQVGAAAPSPRNGSEGGRGRPPAKTAALREIAATIDRLVYYAGWADKYEQVLGNVNPVASPHFNFTVTEPMGVVGVLAPNEAPLLALVSLFAPAIASGNTVVALASSTQPYPSIVLGEMLATSDLPGGVVNLLTGFRQELVPTFATHTHLRALVGVANADERKTLKLGAAESVKRVKLHAAEEKTDWFSDQAQGLYEIRDVVEFKTTWHPIGA